MKRWRGPAMAFVLLLFAVVAAGMIYVRTVGHDPEVWHVDPTATARTGRPNDALALPGGAAPADLESPTAATDPEALARRFHEVVLAAPRTSVVAGGPERGFTTYVQRSAWMGWPDYISVKAVPTEDGAALAIWSRSRFGYSDMGVNRARLERWIAALSERG